MKNRNEKRHRDSKDPKIHFVNSLLSGNSKILNESTLKRFLEGAQSFKYPKELLFSLTDPQKEGTTVISDAFCLCDDATKLNQFAIPFLELLGNEDLFKGTCKSCVEKCYLEIYRVPGFLSFVNQTLKLKQIIKPSVVAWFIKTLACEYPDIRENTVVKEIAELLSQDGSTAVKELITVFFPVRREQEFQISNINPNPQSLSDLEAWEPQHNNDFPFDYRSIEILPTAEELNCPVAPSFGTNKLWKDGPLKEEKVAIALDRQFRLLRSDMTIPMKSELKEEWMLPPGKRRRVFESPRLLDISFEERGAVYLLIEVNMPPPLFGRLRKLSQPDAIKFFNETGRRVLARDSLLVFLSHQSTETEPLVEAVGVITHRDTNEIFSNFGTLRIGVSFEVEDLSRILKSYEVSDYEIQNTFKKGVTRFGKQIALSVFQASSSFFSYKPVLKRLQQMTHIPFAEEFIHQEPPLPILEDTQAPVSVPESISEKLSMDPSQLEAVEYALNHRVALIQGPPGTGKTFCGVQLAQALLASNPRHRILCLCYTNHALDDFLLSLNDEGLGLDRMVRLGRSPKIHERLKNICLGDNRRCAFDRQQNRRFAILKETKESCCGRFHKVKNNLRQLSSANERNHRKVSWSTVSDVLEFGDAAQHEAWKELKFPEKAELSSIEKVGKKRKKYEKTYNNDFLWRQWSNGGRRENLLSEFRRNLPAYGFKSIWDLTFHQRKDLLFEWSSKPMVPVIDEMVELIKEIEDNDREISILYDETKVPSARRASIIGCTTTAASKNSDLLEQIKPTVVIIEEAAEILEANVLTALGDSVEQCFMIGDHKQLRPKLETYDLRQESGKGVDFDVSLFERLATQHHFPVHTLKVQHRMRPEISALIKPTYPGLLDAESVRNRPDVRGLSTNVAFITHQQHETNDEESAIFGSNSKVNLYEVKLVMSTVVYLLQQGYKPSDIVVLTPYLGQLLEIRNHLRKTVGVSISDLDRSDLKRLNPEVDVGHKKNSTPDRASGEGGVGPDPETVRVSTIDNFQGEEALVVIGSLVRSNPEGDIGFVAGAERVNVLLSRARDGLILLGNENTLRNAKSARGRRVWNDVLDLFKEQNKIFQGLPARCENHGISPTVPLCQPIDFEKHTPSGGCCNPCGFVLPSCPLKHECSFNCHPSTFSYEEELDKNERRNREHESIPCRRQIKERCPATKNLDLSEAHFVYRLCFEPTAKPCRAEVMGECPNGHSMNRKCGFPAESASCPVCCKIERERCKEEREVRRRVRELQEAEIKRVKLVKDLEEERLRLTDKISIDRIMAESELLRQEIARVKERQQQSTPMVLETSCDLGGRVLEGPLPGPSASLLFSGSSVSDSSLLQVPSVVPSGTLLLDATTVLDVTNTPIYNSCDTGKEKSITPLSTTGKRGRTVTWVSEKDSKQQDDKKTTQAVRSMLKAAVDEDWVGLYNLVEVNRSYHGSGGLLAKVLEVLVILRLRGYRAELLSQVELIYQEINKSQGPSSLKDIFSCVASFVCFVVAEKDEKLVMTAIRYGESFLSLSRNVQVPRSWKDSVSKALAERGETTVGSYDSLNNTSKATTDSALDAWKRVKSDLGQEKDSPTPAVDKLMKMIGLESVKRNVVNQYHRIVLAQEQQSPAASSYNTRFDGNPGTGKTTVARLYSQYLKEVGILPNQAITKETTGSQLINIGVKGLKDMLEEVKAAKGGVILVDEAYQLNPRSDKQGRQVLDFLLMHAEKMKGEYGDLVWIFAGYKKDMDKLFEHNPGLPSRFTNHFNFEDYSDEELLKIFHDILQRGGAQDNQPEKHDQTPTPKPKNTYPGKPPPPKPVVEPIPFTLSDDKWARVAIRRLGRLRGTVGFGNARAVRILFEKTRSRQAARVTEARQKGGKPDIFRLERDDLLGPKADRSVLMRCEAYKKLQSMEGLREVKSSVDQLLGLVIQNAEREDAEKPMLGVALNRIFLGNPGTGKTTVAKLYASILAQVGLLSKGEVILKNSSDFVGSALGTSEAITRGILKQAEGNVLVIDEAYGLNPSKSGSGAPSGGTQDPYKTAVIDTIVEQVQGVLGEDRAVVMLGYRREMEALIADANPGLSRRFQMEQAFEFSDYDDAALIRILQSMVKSDSLEIDLPTSIFAVQRLARARALPNFGNAGAVNNLLSNAKLNFQARNSRLSSSQRTDRLICEDFCSGGKLPLETNEEDIFKDLSDCDQILSKLKEYKNTINLAKQQGKDPKQLVEFNFLFVGSPGTGKTTIARKMGILFHSLGLLPTDECVETTAADLTTGFVGQASKKTEEVMRRARGKVLFIDEAYQLNSHKGGSYMQEVVDAMVQALTSKELLGQIVIILAGYERDIDDMLKVNQGLRSRFSEKLLFEDFSTNKTCYVIKAALEKQFDLECTPAVEAVLPSIAQRLSTAPNFGNGRDCHTLSKRIFREMANRTAGDEKGTDELIPLDLEKALSKFLEGKKELPLSPTANTISQPQPDSLQSTASSRVVPPPAPILTTIQNMEIVQELVQEKDSKEVSKGGSGVNPFLMELQNYLDQRGLNSKEGVSRISTLDINSPELQQLTSELAGILGLSVSDMTNQMGEWQTNQEDIREKIDEQEKEMEQAKKEKRRALVPIWRCAVCGRADKPYIACYVRPFIVRYSEVEV